MKQFKINKFLLVIYTENKEVFSWNLNINIYKLLGEFFILYFNHMFHKQTITLDKITCVHWSLVNIVDILMLAQKPLQVVVVCKKAT
jgi:hypothetical protein